MPDWFVYVARAADNSLYCGVSTDVERRLAQHNAGAGAKCLRGRLPVVLECCWKCSDRSSALRGEAAFKRMTRKKKDDMLAERRNVCDSRPE